MTEGPDVERLLCDTSFHGHVGKRAQNPERYSHWSEGVLARIDSAILGISVITLAEARYGYLKAKWGQKRIDAEEQRLAAYLQVPLDGQVVVEWGRLKNVCHLAGIAIPDNDLWIAATAAARGYPLVTCDKAHQARINDPALELIVLDPDPTAPLGAGSV